MVFIIFNKLIIEYFVSLSRILKQKGMDSEITLVYTGSRVEGQFLTELLKEKGIGSILKDRLQSSIDAGWADGSPADAVQIFVENFNAENTKNFIDEYFKERDNK